MKFNINDTVDSPLGRGKITQLNGRGDYFVQFGPEGFGNLGGEWFGENELEYVSKFPPPGSGWFPDTLDMPEPGDPDYIEK